MCDIPDLGISGRFEAGSLPLIWFVLLTCRQTYIVKPSVLCVPATSACSTPRMGTRKAVDQGTLGLYVLMVFLYFGSSDFFQDMVGCLSLNCFILCSVLVRFNVCSYNPPST